MPASFYDFFTTWRFDDASITEVADILEDTASLPRWWPQLFRKVTIAKPGGEHGLGEVADCECRARLPYTLRFTYTCVEVRYPFGSTIESTGDLVGRGVWGLRERDGGVDVTYSWRVYLEKPLLRAVSGVLRPLLAGNHAWSMERGEEGLRREIVRRRTAPRAPAPQTGA
jgi:polyketide cyclase/dehydrase/lipid transport protein